MQSFSLKSTIMLLLGLFASGLFYSARADLPGASEKLKSKDIYAKVIGRAENLAREPFIDADVPLPSFVQNLSYDEYRDIRFRPERTIWRNEDVPFTIRLFHRGLYFCRKVSVNIVEDDQIKPVTYSPDLFDFGRIKHLADPKSMASERNPGFAGFQIFYPLYGQEPREIAVFLGASYFRAVGRDQTYGLSARGLAINTGSPCPEEFPFFREYWIERPGKNDAFIRIYALLDGPSITGAYRFTVHPGSTAVIEIKAALFARKEITKLGIAPLTSMFFSGECRNPCSDDYRPEIHDSDGLLMAAGGGEWLWRPLLNPDTVTENSFHDNLSKGFGLFQRDRVFDHYQDLEAGYHRRPSAWVEPISDWGPGAVHLVQIPSSTELNDNIVAFWVPQKPIRAGDHLQYDYKLHLFLEKPGLPPAAKVISTRTGRGGIYQESNQKGNPVIRLFVIEFSGDALQYDFRKSAENPIEAVISASSGQIRNSVVQKNEYAGTVRVSFELLSDRKDQKDDAVEMRCFLRSGKDVLSETWTFLWK